MLLDIPIKMYCLSVMLGVVLFGVASAGLLRPSRSSGETLCDHDYYTYCPSELLPAIPVMTNCGFMSKSSIEDVRDFFYNFSLNAQSVYYDYKKLKRADLEFGEPLLIPSGLDPYWHYDGDDGTTCWLWQPKTTRLYLDAQVLRNFVDPLINISATEYKLAVEREGNSSNMGLKIAIAMDELVEGIRKLDCVLNSTGIGESSLLDPLPEKCRTDNETYTSEELVIVTSIRQLKDLAHVSFRVHRDLQILVGYRGHFFPASDRRRCFANPV